MQCKGPAATYKVLDEVRRHLLGFDTTLEIVVLERWRRRHPVLILEGLRRPVSLLRRDLLFVGDLKVLSDSRSLARRSDSTGQ